LGRVRQARPAARFERSPAAIAGPAPLLGEHTQSILRELDYDAQAIENLLNAGMIGTSQ
jgi:crotonobetainyl-CoA:carnitine CoA-transferase CaiB-like acyl-CoA transferase